MDFRLIESLSDNQVDELYFDVVDGDDVLLSSGDREWTCYLYVATPAAVMSDLHVRTTYDPMIYVHICNTTVASCGTFYYYPNSTNPSPTINAYTKTTKKIICDEIYDCFYTIYEQNFSNVMACNHPDYPSVDVNLDYLEKYAASSSFYEGIARGRHQSHKNWSLNSGTIVRYQFFNYHSYYGCNTEIFNPFYRKEEINEVVFNSNIAVGEYIRIDTFHYLLVYFSHKANLSWFMIGHEYKLTRHNNYGSIYVHMTCSR